MNALYISVPLECRHLIRALNAWTAFAYYATAHLSAAQFSVE